MAGRIAKKGKDLVQLWNPKSKRWVLIDKKVGGILRYRKSEPYKGIPIARGKEYYEQNSR